MDDVCGHKMVVNWRLLSPLASSLSKQRSIVLFPCVWKFLWVCEEKCTYFFLCVCVLKRKIILAVVNNIIEKEEKVSLSGNNDLE